MSCGQVGGGDIWVCWVGVVEWAYGGDVRVEDDASEGAEEDGGQGSG